MANSLTAVRGMHDILPSDTPRWQRVEGIIQGVLEAYGYREIRLPVVERTELFERSIGEATDIVSKEMYTFPDRNGDSLTLRPEGTASCVRAGIEHGLFQGGVQRLWYTGPMFRHERPQKGRFRQFYQVGAEAFGLPGPDIDAELILLTARFWQALQVEGLTLELNTLGDLSSRQRYRDELVTYFSGHGAALGEENLQRLERNPLRILDSKDPALGDLIAGAPAMKDFLDPASAAHFEELRSILTEAGIQFVINPRLVRGLDYYNRTVFEWTSSKLGAQGTVCAGGRYDTLVEHFGGRSTPGVGFAMGMERLLDLVPGENRVPDVPVPHAYLVMPEDAAAASRAMAIAETLRNELPGLRLVVHCGGGGMRSQLRRADKSGAALALILGEEELRTSRAAVKDLREEAGQSLVAISDLATELKRRLSL